MLELFKDISRIPRGHSAIIDSQLFKILRDTLAKFQWVSTHSELKDRFVKLNLEIIQDFVLRKKLFYPSHNSELQIDDFRKQISLQNEISPLKDRKNITSSSIDGLNLFSEDIVPSKLRNFSLTIRSLIDMDYLSMYCFNSTATFDTQTFLTEFFRIRKPNHIIDPKLSKFYENLQKQSNYFAYSTKSYNISPNFHTFLSPTICGEPTQLYRKDDNLTLSIVLAKFDIINQPIYSIEKEIFRPENLIHGSNT